MRTIRRQAKATSLDHAIELAKQHAKEQHRPSKVMADLMGVELKTYYRWLLDNTLPLNRIAQFEALTGSRFISEYLSVLHGDRVVIEIPRGHKGKAADIAQVQSQTAAALALLAKWHEDGSGVDETIEALTNVLALLAYQRENVKKAGNPELDFGDGERRNPPGHRATARFWSAGWQWELRTRAGEKTSDFYV